eukprot:gene10431-biopygen2986
MSRQIIQVCSDASLASEIPSPLIYNHGKLVIGGTGTGPSRDPSPVRLGPEGPSRDRVLGIQSDPSPSGALGRSRLGLVPVPLWLDIKYTCTYEPCPAEFG